MTKNRVFIITVILLIIVLALLFYKMPFNKPSEKIIIADAQQPVFALIYIADKKNYFKEAGLDVTYNKFIFGKDALANVIKGHSDLATVYEAPVVRKVFEGAQISAITTLHRSNRNTGVIGLKDNGIMTAEDLKGKKIGVPKGTNAEIFLYSLLLINSIDLTDVTVIDMLPEAMPEALKNGVVDAVSLFNPYLDKVEHTQNPKKISIIFSNTYTEMSLLVGRKNYIAQNDDKLTKLLQALVKAEKFIEDNPEESLTIVNNWLPKLTKNEIRRQWDAFDPIIQLDNTLLTTVTREAQFYKDAGFYQSPVPNFRNIIFTDYLKKIKPEAVTIY
jgi:ABC-type nitrate/sulfonate/bicarbonate transport system substrate-binding protein